MKPPDVSVIVVNYNTDDLLDECFRSVFEYPPECSVEVILVDNGPDKNAVADVLDRYPLVRLVRMKGNVGFGKACNSGLEIASGPAVLFLNPDARLWPGAIDVMLAVIDSAKDIGIVGPRQLDKVGRTQLTFGKFPSIINEINRKTLHLNIARRADEVAVKAAGADDVDWISASCMMVKRKCLKEGGLFDEDYFLYFEDIDLCKRIKAAGYKIRYVFDAVIMHIGGESAARNLAMAMIEYRKSQLLYLEKHHSRGLSLLVRGMILLKSIVLSAFKGFAWVIGAGSQKAEAKTLASVHKKIFILSLKGRVGS